MSGVNFFTESRLSLEKKKKRREKWPSQKPFLTDHTKPHKEGNIEDNYMVNVVSSSRYKIDRKKIRQIADSILAEKGYSQGYVLNIIFVGKIKMRQIAKKYKKEDVALPVLSFPYKAEKMGEERIIGEVFICYPQAVLLAAEREKKVEYILTELIRHGINNLIG